MTACIAVAVMACKPKGLGSERRNSAWKSCSGHASTTFVNPGYPCMCVRRWRPKETRVIKQPSQRSVDSILSCLWIKWPSSTLAWCISFFSLILNLYILLVFSAAAFKHLLSNNGVPNKVCGCTISMAKLIITFFFSNSRLMVCYVSMNFV